MCVVCVMRAHVSVFVCGYVCKCTWPDNQYSKPDYDIFVSLSKSLSYSLCSSLPSCINENLGTWESSTPNYSIYGYLENQLQIVLVFLSSVEFVQELQL